LSVRLAPRYRDDVSAIRTVPVAVPNGNPKSPTTYIALSDVAEVKLESGTNSRKWRGTIQEIRRFLR
jgi:cobalt-zinc-cadmium resistance protein CzcA